MNEADILATTYTDKCTVLRRYKGTTEYGETVFNDNITVYENIECALSYGSVGKLNQSKSVATATKECKLFVHPDVEILPNDIVLVDRLGKTTEFVAGECEYHFSHNNIILSKKEEEA